MKYNRDNWDFSNLKVGVAYLEKALAPYITGEWTTLDNDKKIFEHDWKFIDSLLSYNILLF